MKHILFDLKECPPDLLDDEDFVNFMCMDSSRQGI